MEEQISRFVLFVILPGVICVASNFALVPVCLIFLVNMFIDWMFPAKFKISRSIIITAALCQLLLAAEIRNSLVFVSSMTFKAPTHTEFSFDALSAPFVSVIIFGGSSEVKKDSARLLGDVKYSKLVLEVLTDADSVPRGDLCVFWAAGAAPASDNALAFLVRDVMVSSRDEKRVVIPKVKSEGIDKSHGVYVESKLMLYSEDVELETAAVPVLTVVGLWKENMSLVSRLLAGDLAKGSSDVWLCGGSIRVAKYSKFTAPPNVAVFNDAVERFGSCQTTVASDVVVQRFIDVHPPLKTQAGRLEFTSGSCLVAFANSTVGQSRCNNQSDDQLFVPADSGLILRSLGSCLFAGSGPKCLCLDGGVSPVPGSAVKLYHCAKGNRNQQFRFSKNRLMLGSYCVHANATFQICDGASDDEGVRFVVS